MGGSALMQRLVRTCTTNVGQLGYRQLHPKVKLIKCNIRVFGTGPKGENDEGGNTDMPDRSPPNPWLIRRQGSQFGGRRPLSPLERISQLLPQDSLSPEVVQLREQKQDEEEDKVGTHPLKDHHTLDVSVTGAQSMETPAEHNSVATRDAKQDTVSEYTVAGPRSDTQGDGMFAQTLDCVNPTLPGERLLTFGELLIAEYRKKRQLEYRKMFQLEEGVCLQSSWGTIGHSDIMGRPSGVFIRTHRGMPFFIRRPTLEEYVLFMKRGPAISYPKDANTMLMMMDITEGDCVLEAGSGSGAMSLFLSRAVGSQGSVVSVEIREDHHRRAVLNYKRWRSAWSLRRGEEWPDNVQFHNTDLQTASSLLAGRGFHSIALDMISPHIVLPTVTPHLHPGSVCAVYLANITQVIELLEGIRCSALPFLCERIIEVQHRDWLLAPALQKDGRFYTSKAPPPIGTHEEGEKSNEEGKKEMVGPQHPPFGSVPYVARPHPEQLCHTAFLVKLRKCVR